MNKTSNNIPDVELSKITECLDGDWILSENMSNNGKIGIIQLKHIGEGKFLNKDFNFITNDTCNKLKYTILKDEDLLVSRMADPICRSCIIPKLEFQTVTVVDVTILRPNTSLVDKKYLNFIFNSDIIKHQTVKFTTGTTRARISRKNLEKLKIPLPSLLTQQKIVSILEKAEKLQEMRKEADELTKDYLRAVFLKMFGNPLKNSKRWEVKKMKDISKKIVNGTTPKGGKQVYVEKGIVFFRSQNVWKNRLLLDDVAYIDDNTHAKMIKSSLRNKDILMTKTGRINTENSSLGRSAMFLGEDNSANINGHVYLIRLQENIIPEFVLFIITTNEYREYIRSVCVGGIDKRQINKEHLQNFPIIFPPIELQNKFVSIVKEVEAMKEQQKQSRLQIFNFFNHLIQKAFKGELVC